MKLGDSAPLPPTPRPWRPLLLTTILAVAVVLIGIVSVAWPERRGSDALVGSSSSLERNLGLTLVVLAIPAVLVAAGALSTMLGRLPAPRLVRGGLVAGLWCASAAFVVAWLGITAVAFLSAGFAERDARAERQLVVMPERIAALAGVTGTRDAQLVASDLASGHNLFVTADLDAQLTTDERLQTLARISAVLAQHQSNDLRMLVEARIGPLAVGVSPDNRQNSERLSLAAEVSSATTADLVVVLWRKQGDELVDDDGLGIEVVIHSMSQSPDRLAAAAVPVVRANAAAETTITALRHPPGRPPPSHYGYTLSSQPTAPEEQASVIVRQQER